MKTMNNMNINVNELNEQALAQANGGMNVYRTTGGKLGLPPIAKTGTKVGLPPIARGGGHMDF